VIESCLLISAFSIRFSLSEKASRSLLQLIHRLIPSNNSLPKSYEKVSSFSNQNESPEIKCNYFCSNCQTQTHKVGICQSCHSNSTKNTFHFVDIEPQLSGFISRNMKLIESVFERRHRMKDLCNSNHYILDPNRLNLMIYTDGINLDKKNKSSLWPVVLSLIELPSEVRDSKANKFIFGVWKGKKPKSKFLFDELIKFVDKWRNEGIKVNVAGELVSIKVDIYGLIADAPAKATSLFLKNHTGYYSCPYCKIRGQYVH